ncbi:MAG TPA: hypothetical protein VFG72_14270 [Marmoricola sp.]|nr:hypothetical protein [Marmoricola sp.]
MSEHPNVEHGDSNVALPNEILRSVVGSGVHGIAIEGTDDHDEMGIYIEPPASCCRSTHPRSPSSS